MPQLKEDEWPNDHQPTTEEGQLENESSSVPQDTRPEYPPDLPPEALPTKD